MLPQLLSALLLAFAASAASGDDISEQNTKMLVETVGVQDDAVAYFSADNDPRFKCLHALLTVYEPEKQFGVYTYYYQGQNGQPGTDVDYCMNLTATESFRFGFSPCDEGAISFDAQGYYFNGVNCFVGRFPLLGNDHCLLWVKQDAKDSLPEECGTQFDNYCGPQRYTLYDKDQCS